MKHLIDKIKKMPIIKPLHLKRKMRNSYSDILNHTHISNHYSNPDDLHIGEIEINRNCNLNCVMCNSSMSNRPNINMDLGLFEKAIRYTKSVGKGKTSLHTIGEPLLNKQLPEYFEIMRKYGVKLFLSTNALLLQKNLDLLINYADIIYELRFSIDGASKETYEKIRFPGKWEQLIANIEYFYNNTKEHQPFSRVRISSIISKDVEHEIAYHLKYYSRYTNMENIDLNLVSGLSPDNNYFLNKSILKKHITPWSPCEQLFSSTMHILNDGRVSACCRDYNGDLVYGNINHSTPIQLINNKIVLDLRKKHLENILPKDSLCASCYRVDPKVSKMFQLFVHILVQKYSKRWDTEKMQSRFDEFFEIFSDKIPDLEQFINLVRT